MKISGLQSDDLRLQPLYKEIEESLTKNLYQAETTISNLKDLAESHQGLILEDSTTVYAFILFQIREPVCFIEFAFASEQTDKQNFLFYLIKNLVDLCRQDGQILSIRCDFIPWFGTELQSALVAAGFQHCPRLLLRAELPYQKELDLSPDLEFLLWTPKFNSRAAKMLKQIFANSEESKWDPSITTEAGCQRFLAATYGGRFGIFDPNCSFLLKYKKKEAGLALCTWDHEGNGFIASFGIMPHFSGLGLGGKLLSKIMDNFSQALAPALELAVSEGNIAAMRLYASHDFKAIDRTSLYYLELY
ncbi:MAG: GNAT family N-acetyltransferase [Firmicutes bacterium]|nr:GNAT family N-acetyltransferase [Bacillota bacterium]